MRKLILGAAVVLLLVGTMFGFQSQPGRNDAAAFVGPVAPPVVPTVHAGTLVFSGAVGAMGLGATLGTSAAVCATGAGCVAVVAAAGFATGYFGASLLCEGIDTYVVEDGCNPWEPSPGTPSGFATSDFESCTVQLSSGSGAGQCVTISWDELGDLGRGAGVMIGQQYNENGTYIAANDHLGGCVTTAWQSPSYRTIFESKPAAVGSNGGCWPSNGLTSASAAAPYTDGWFKITSACDLVNGEPNGSGGFHPGTRNCGVRPGDYVTFHRMPIWCCETPETFGTTANPQLSTYPVHGAADISPTVNARGMERQYRVEARCWTAPDVFVDMQGFSGWSFDSEYPDMPENPCPAGSVVEWFKFGVGTVGRTGLVIDWDPLVEWEADPNATDFEWEHHECVTVGAACEVKVETNVADPDYGECKWGGVVMVSTACDTPGYQTVPRTEVHDPWVEEPAPTTTTTPPPTTLPPPGDPGDCEGQFCVGGPGGPPGGEGAECFPSGWGWLNPVEWVLKPVKCALMWAFWDQETADEISALGAEHGWTQLVADSSVTTDPAAGPCIDMDVAEICTEPILSTEPPAGVSLLISAVVLFFGVFEVVGLFARITGG